jgi:hypothetical protein
VVVAATRCCEPRQLRLLVGPLDEVLQGLHRVARER